MNAITLIRQLDALVREAEEAKSAFSYIATSLSGQITEREKLIPYARLYEDRLHRALNPETEGTA